MMAKASDLYGLSLRAKGGEAGSVCDLLVDETSWRVRWIVVHLGSMLFGRRGLVHASRLRMLDVGARSLPVDLDRDEVERSPGIESDPPVSRVMEERRVGPANLGPFGVADAHLAFLAARLTGEPGRGSGSEARSGKPAAPRLRSIREMTGYLVCDGAGGELGDVVDFEIDGLAWAVSAIVVEADGLVPQPSVTLPTRSISRVSWHDQLVVVSADIKPAGGPAQPHAGGPH